MSEFTIPFVCHTYQLYSGESVKIQFFADTDRFRHFVDDHLLSESEPWWERLIGVKFRKALRQKMQSGDVSIEQAGLYEAFAECDPVLDRGISFSISFPVYIAFTEERHRGGSAKWHETKGYYFLSEDGFLIVVRRDILRTAYFRPGIKGGNLSKKELFYEAWKSVKDIGLNRLVRDTKGGDEYKHVVLSHVTSEHWRRCPDPRRRKDPRQSRIAGTSKMERTKAAALRLIATLDETRDWNYDHQRRMREETVFARMVEVCTAWLTEFQPDESRPEDIPGFAEFPEEHKKEIREQFFTPNATILMKAISKCLDRLDDDLETDLEQAAREATQYVLEMGY